jgi:hypothetical protein
MFKCVRGDSVPQGQLTQGLVHVASFEVIVRECRQAPYRLQTDGA